MVYAEQIAVAKELIAEFGQKVTWRNFEVVQSSNDKPWEVTGETYTDHTVDTVFLPEKRDSFRGQQIQDGEQEGFEKVYLPAVAFTPTLQDVILCGDDTYTIRYIDRINPNGEQILYNIGVRR